MRFRDSASAKAAAEYVKGSSSEDLKVEYDLITREREGGHNSLSGINAQNDIARELERRGE